MIGRALYATAAAMVDVILDRYALAVADNAPDLDTRFDAPIRSARNIGVWIQTHARHAAKTIIWIFLGNTIGAARAVARGAHNCGIVVVHKRIRLHRVVQNGEVPSARVDDRIDTDCGIHARWV